MARSTGWRLRRTDLQLAWKGISTRFDKSSENLSKPWQDSIGEDWRNVQETWLHTLGNLTLTGYNTEYSDKPFAEKRDMKGGFKQSPLRLNEDLGELDKWDENAIRDPPNGSQLKQLLYGKAHH